VSFRNEAERAAVCAALCSHVNKAGVTWWTEDGPTDAAVAVVEGRSGLSHGERLMVLVAWAVWNGRGSVNLSELMDTLDGRNIRAVGLLLVALAGDAPGSVARWLEQYGKGAARV
jgi:hypothetical protein